MQRRNTATNGSTSNTSFPSGAILPKFKESLPPTPSDKKKDIMRFLRLWMANLRRNYPAAIVQFVSLGFLCSIGFNAICFHTTIKKPRKIDSRILGSTLDAKPRTLIVANDALTKMKAYNPLEWEYPIELNNTLPIRKNDDKKYERYRMHLADETTECSFIADWELQRSAKPTCNVMHEIELRVGNPGVSQNLRFLDQGAYKMVWDVLDVTDQPQDFVLKTVPAFATYKERDFYTHVRDALVMEEGAASPYILNMYSWCSHSGIVERAYGTLEHWVRKFRHRVSNLELLEVALMLARGVSDMHNFHNGMATVAHADIKPPQFLLTTNPEESQKQLPTIKLNDFNRCAFLTSKDPPDVCPFYIDSIHMGSTYRAPEEFMKQGDLTDKIDVFSLGSVLYFLLEDKDPFVDTEDYEHAQKNIIEGVEPKLSVSVAHSNDPSIRAIVEAMRRCRQVRQEDRPQSREIAHFLSTELERIKRMKHVDLE